MQPQPIRLTIDRLGAQGDGIAETERGPVFVPFTLPGESITAAVERDRATLMAVVEPSPLRVEPPCRHFGDCGGCSLQHLEQAAYRDWKRERVIEALASRGIDVPVGPLVPCEPATRRRAVFSVSRADGKILLGYRAAQSHRVVDVVECPILLPVIPASFEMLRRLADAACATPKPFRMSVTSTASGLDVAIAEAGPLTDGRRRILADLALREDLARLTLDGDLVVEPRPPMIMVGDIPVLVPAGGFLQATTQAEDAMAALVQGHLAGAKRVADLFAGSGSFALRLARKADVHAVEGDAAALSALDRAFRGATGLRRVTGERRDLFVRPLTWKELGAFDGLVFDPPRAGAEDQVKQIARAGVPKVAAVSCNPATLVRDLRILLDGGYTLTSVTPIDQFLWSPHVEVVALLEKPRKRR